MYIKISESFENINHIFSLPSLYCYQIEYFDLFLCLKDGLKMQMVWTVLMVVWTVLMVVWTVLMVVQTFQVIFKRFKMQMVQTALMVVWTALMVVSIDVGGARYCAIESLRLMGFIGVDLLSNSSTTSIINVPLLLDTLFQVL